MKKLFILSIILSMIWGISFAEEPEKKDLESICPKTLMKTDCLTCHIAPTFELKETCPNAKYNYPSRNFKIHGDIAYYILQGIEAGDVQDAFDYVLWHPEVKKIIIEIHSPGGSLFDGYKIVGLMQHMMSRGYVVETRVYGFAASAGFLIAASGTKGHRFVSKTAELMWHELMSFAMFSVETPSDSEEKARVLRHLQDTANHWLSSVSNLSYVQISEMIRKKEFWMSGAEAIEYGFADGELK